MTGLILSIEFKVVPHPVEKGYFMYEFHHPVHGKKYMGCFKKDTPKHWQDAVRRFKTNCGYPEDVKADDVFNFWSKEDHYNN